MSRIGRLPLEIPKSVTVTLDKTTRTVKAKGVKGEGFFVFHQDMEVTLQDNVITVTRPSDSNPHKALHGMTRRMLGNLIHGVEKGFEKKLVFSGVGYKADVKDGGLLLNLGFSHPVDVKFPKGISAKVEKNVIILYGIDKHQLGQFAADIKAIRPPEPYKGAGIRYENETIRRKDGKKAA